MTAGNYSFSGAIDGDVVTLNNQRHSGCTYIDRNVGTNKNVSASGIAIVSAVDGGANVYGYQIVPTANANIGTITQRAITVSSQTGQSQECVRRRRPEQRQNRVFGDERNPCRRRHVERQHGPRRRRIGRQLLVYDRHDHRKRDGFSGGNYAVTFNGTANPFQISQAALTGTIANQTKTYGQNDPALAGIAVNLGGVVYRSVVDINGNSTPINDSGNVATTLSSLTRDGG